MSGSYGKSAIAGSCDHDSRIVVSKEECAAGSCGQSGIAGSW